MKRQTNKRKPSANVNNTTSNDTADAKAAQTNDSVNKNSRMHDEASVDDNIKSELLSDTAVHTTNIEMMPTIKNNRVSSFKRKKLHSSINALFDTANTSLQTGDATPIVLTPRSLFTALCQVHENEFPGMLPSKEIDTIKAYLPSVL